MSNYVNPPNIDDTCPVCLDEYGHTKNIFVPKTCPHPICKKCVKKCKECPYCKVAYKNKREMTENAKRVKHIYFLRKNYYTYVKSSRDCIEQYGGTYNHHYDLVHDTYVIGIVHMEKDLQDNMNARDRAARRRSLLRHPYNSVPLEERMQMYNLIDRRFDENI